MNPESTQSFAAADIHVLGGGISGLTTAIVLQALGLKVQIIAEKIPNATIATDPGIPTAYAMASAYPHNLQIKNLEQISDDSQSVFSILCAESRAGVELHEIFEVYEDKPEAPPLGSRRMKMEYFDGTPQTLARTINPPARSAARYLWGWKFNSYFADMPVYLDYLWKLFYERGGQLRTQRITSEILQQSAGRTFVNCLGSGAVQFCEDQSPLKILRGRQVLVKDAPRLVGKHELPVAYNYTPVEEIFPRGDGNPEYLHFFSRSDGWLLGQTREPGLFDEDGNWHGIAAPVPTFELDEISIPKQILELNRELLKSWMNVELNQTELVGREGLRYYRDPLETGVRLNSSIEHDNFVAHNYGHGGSGITMSWGCALEVARMICNHIKPKVPRGKTQLDRILQNSLACTL